MVAQPPTPEPSNPQRPAKPPEFLAVETIKDALAFVEDAKIIDKAKGHRHFEGFRPIYFLLSHAIELVLKAYLLSQGTKPKRLRDNDIRHNLEELLKKAQEAGFRPSERFIEITIWLSPCHKDHTFRYRRRAGRVTLPLPMKVIEIVTMEALLVERTARAHYMAMQDRTPTQGSGEDS